MNSIHSDGVDWMQIRQRLTFRPTERNVPAKVLDGAARFDSSHHISFGHMLVFETHPGLRKNAYLVQPS
jgi:hypothetical protein